MVRHFPSTAGGGFLSLGRWDVQRVTMTTLGERYITSRCKPPSWRVSSRSCTASYRQLMVRQTGRMARLLLMSVGECIRDSFVLNRTQSIHVVPTELVLAVINVKMMVNCSGEFSKVNFISFRLSPARHSLCWFACDLRARSGTSVALLRLQRCTMRVHDPRRGAWSLLCILRREGDICRPSPCMLPTLYF